MKSAPSRRNARWRVLACAVSLAVSSAANAGAWAQPEQTLFLRLATKAYRASSIFDSSSSVVPGDWWDTGARFDEFSFNLIAEYGVWGPITLTFENTAKLMHSDYTATRGNDLRVNGFSDAILGVRWGFWQRSLVAAAEAKVEIPTGYTRNSDCVSLGAAQFNGVFKLLFGGGVPSPFRNYFDTSIGYRLRGGPFADDLVGSASVGAETLKNLWLRLGASGVFNLGPAGSSASGGQPADASYVGGSVALTYLFDFGLGVELAGALDLWGRNSFAGWGIELVLQYKHSFRR